MTLWWLEKFIFIQIPIKLFVFEKFYKSFKNTEVKHIDRSSEAKYQQLLNTEVELECSSFWLVSLFVF